jgi:CheY-like chemotaxis protein
MNQPSLKVLIADDEVKFAEAVAEYLKLEGYAVLLAFTGSQALDLIRREQPDLLILDLKIPEVSSEDILDRLRTASPKTHVIIVTAYHDGGVKEGLIRASGIAGYLYKPLPSLEVLGEAVQSALRV